VVSACYRGHCWQLALALLRKAQDANVTPDEIVYTTLVGAYEKVNHWQGALVLLGEMVQAGIVGKTVASAITASACAKGAQRDRAVWLFGQQQNSTAIDTTAYNVAFVACERGQQWTRAIQLLVQMCSHSLQPNAITHSALIGVCEKSGQTVFTHAAVVAMRRTVWWHVVAGPSSSGCLLEEPVCAVNCFLSYDVAVSTLEAHLIRRRMNCPATERPILVPVSTLNYSRCTVFARRCNDILSVADGIGTSRTRHSLAALGMCMPSAGISWWSGSTGYGTTHPDIFQSPTRTAEIA